MELEVTKTKPLYIHIQEDILTLERETDYKQKWHKQDPSYMVYVVYYSVASSLYY